MAEQGQDDGSPDGARIFYKIGEVARIAGVKTSVIRFWEEEFPSIRPEKTSRGHRRYSRKSLEEILLIKKLLYQEGFKIPGARKRLRTLKREESDNRISEATNQVSNNHFSKDKAALDELIVDLKLLLEHLTDPEV